MDKKNMSQGEQKKQNMLQKAFAKFSFTKLSMVMALMSLLSVSAFAADGAGDTLVDTVTVTALLSETGVFTKAGIGIIWSLIIANPILEAMVGVGLLSLIFAVFRRVKRAARF